MALTTFAAGDKPTAAQLNQFLPLSARKVADETINNTATFQDDDALRIAVAANCVYEMHAEVRYTTGAVPNIKFQWTFPAGLTMRYSAHIIPAAAAAWVDFPLIQTDAVGCDDSASLATMTGQVIVSSTAGTLQLQWAQNTANASNTVVSAGSYIRLQRTE